MTTLSQPLLAEPRSLRPMAWGQSLLFFGIPTLALIIGFHGVMPALIGLGILPFYAYFVGVGVPLAAMLLASLFGLRAEGYPLTWAALRERFRLGSMNRRAWLWTLGGYVAAFLLTGLIAPLIQLLVNQGRLPVPATIPTFLDPRSAANPTAWDQAFGGIYGNWLAPTALAILLFFNIVGEEFWWRGYILPRQELAFGSRTWIVHGVLWALFHVFKWWDVPTLLPVTLILSFVVTRLRNNTPGLVLHTLFNGLGLILVLLAALGILRV